MERWIPHLLWGRVGVIISLELERLCQEEPPQNLVLEVRLYLRAPLVILYYCLVGSLDYCRVRRSQLKREHVAQGSWGHRSPFRAKVPLWQSHNWSRGCVPQDLNHFEYEGWYSWAHKWDTWVSETNLASEAYQPPFETDCHLSGKGVLPLGSLVDYLWNTFENERKNLL